MLFVWDPKYETGILEIDLDHKGLVKLINDLYEAIQDGSSGSLLLPIFSVLKHYTEHHFAREEAYMASCDAPNRQSHMSEHREMVLKLAELEARHRGGEAAISLEALTFLRDWLKNHICAVDQAMSVEVRQSAHRKDDQEQGPTP